MRRTHLAWLVAGALSVSASAMAQGPTMHTAITDDPYLWLEDVEADKSLDWVRAREFACTAEDILWRRTKLGLHLTPDQCAAVDRHLQPERSMAATI